MILRHFVTASVLALLGTACGRGSSVGEAPSAQEFVRQVNATPAAVVSASAAVFKDYGIPVATVDEPEGKLLSVPMSLAGNWGTRPAADRVSCASAGADTGSTAAGPGGKLVLEVEAKESRGGSTFSLKQRSEGAVGCVLQNDFVGEMLDAIETRATARR
jgi:hypothetical protein